MCHLLNGWNSLTCYTLLICLRKKKKKLHSREFFSSFYLLYLSFDQGRLFILCFFSFLCFVKSPKCVKGIFKFHAFNSLILFFFALNVKLCVQPLACCQGSGAKHRFQIVFVFFRSWIRLSVGTVCSRMSSNTAEEFSIYAAVHFVSLQNVVMYKCNTKVTHWRESFRGSNAVPVFRISSC